MFLTPAIFSQARPLLVGKIGLARPFLVSQNGLTGSNFRPKSVQPDSFYPDHFFCELQLPNHCNIILNNEMLLLIHPLGNFKHYGLLK